MDETNYRKWADSYSSRHIQLCTNPLGTTMGDTHQSQLSAPVVRRYSWVGVIAGTSLVGSFLADRALDAVAGKVFDCVLAYLWTAITAFL